MTFFYSKTAQKSIKKLDIQVKSRIKAGIEAIPAGDIKKLSGYTDLYRLRIGDYRVLFEWQGSEIYIDDVLPRGQAYKTL